MKRKRKTYQYELTIRFETIGPCKKHADALIQFENGLEYFVSNPSGGFIDFGETTSSVGKTKLKRVSKMRIAFDVKGTIDGPRGQVIIETLKALQKLGHECTVWSNLYLYAVQAVSNHGLKCSPASKLTRGEAREREIEPFDVAIEDDRGQTWLAAKRLIFVDEITDAETLVKQILEGSK